MSSTETYRDIARELLKLVLNHARNLSLDPEDIIRSSDLTEKQLEVVFEMRDLLDDVEDAGDSLEIEEPGA